MFGQSGRDSLGERMRLEGVCLSVFVFPCVFFMRFVVLLVFLDFLYVLLTAFVFYVFWNIWLVLFLPTV